MELEETAVRERIYTFQQRCDKAIPRWRWAAGVVAGLILAAQFLLANSTPVPLWGMAVVGMTMLPLVGMALLLGGRAFYCARKNRHELQPPLLKLGQLDVREIGEKITADKATCAQEGQ